MQITRFLDLCSGIGGGRLGLEQAGMDHSFEEFKEAGTSGKDIMISNGPSVFADRIIRTYKSKGA